MGIQRGAFIFDDVRVTPDCQIGRHSHSRWELSHVVTGGGTREIGDRAEPIAEGELILIPPHIPHVWKFDPEITDDDGCIANISVFFEPETLEGLAAVIPELRETVNNLTALREAISFVGGTRSELVELLYSMRQTTAEIRLPAIMRMLFILAHAENGISAGAGTNLSRTEMRLEKIRTFCACNFMREIRLDEIALYAGMNKSAFCTFMKRQTGCTFSEYLNTYRLERSAERLRYSDDTVADIAFSVGFPTVTYFNRLFRARYGMTPKEARRITSQNQKL